MQLKLKSILLLLVLSTPAYTQINRKALVERHKVIVHDFDTMASLSVGNGNFAATVDATGMQTFPEYYKNGVPLSIQCDWGWHSFPNDSNYKFEETFKELEYNGTKRNYSIQNHENIRKNLATEYFRSNPHRLLLGLIGFDIIGKSGSPVSMENYKIIKQELNPWTGIIKTMFKVSERMVYVYTCADPDTDKLSFKISSDLFASQRLRFKLKFPTPSGKWKDTGTDFSFYKNIQSEVIRIKNNKFEISRHIDTTRYRIELETSHNITLHSQAQHEYLIIPDPVSNTFELRLYFTNKSQKASKSDFGTTEKKAAAFWKKFWSSGAAMDLHQSKDTRANELERRIILSQYLTRIQCYSGTPPQETGLTYNSWYGRPHMEMYWWHATHFNLWRKSEVNHQAPENFNCLDWYLKSLQAAKAMASRQGYKGARWQKMTDPYGNETPSSVGSFLIWQQPHVIYLCEQLYQLYPKSFPLNKYAQLIFETADFMSDFLVWDNINGYYRLGPGIIPAQESHDRDGCINPAFELAYWKYGLSVAAKWKKRLSLPPHTDWEYKLAHIAPLPIKDKVYLTAFSAPDSYTNPEYTRDHPSVLAALACIPDIDLVDKKTMANTLDTILKKWNWSSTWGWDYPMIAITAAKLNKPGLAVETLLMNTQKNTYLPNGHNYQDGRLTIYLPGNGAFLTAIAEMGKNGFQGFPKDGQWKVRAEGF